MPIRFQCQRCRQSLSIASRKAAAEIECPKCGQRQVVPTADAADAAMTMSQFDEAEEVVEPLAELMVYDDPPEAVDSPATERTGQDQPKTPAPSGETGLEPPPAPDELVPQGMILFRRRSLYVQGILFLVVAVVGFGAGYVIGRSRASLELLVEEQQAARQRVLIDGTVVYNPGGGRIEGDRDAVIILLPAGKTPAKKLSAQGIRPKDPAPPQTYQSLRMIEELGGAYARADADGSFSVMLPDTGPYYLLLISRHARRPDGSEVEVLDQDEMDGFFRRSEYLIGRQKYRWSREELLIRTEIEHDFGRDGQS